MAGMILAMFVRAVIVYQILYTDINDHLKEYAAGHRSQARVFIKFIIAESMILLFIGFLPGMLVSALLFAVADASAGLPADHPVRHPDCFFCRVRCVQVRDCTTQNVCAALLADIF